MSVKLGELTGTYTFDKDHTRLGFVARHAMVTKVRGTFEQYDGSIEINGDEPAKSSARVVIKGKSITTGNEQRDGHLRSNDFLALDEYPEITFESTGIEQISEADYKLNGDLTVRGVTRPVTLDVEFTGQSEFQDKTRLGFEARTVINRKDFGVNWNLALETGGVLVGEKVTLELDIEAIKVSD